MELRITAPPPLTLRPGDCFAERYSIEAPIGVGGFAHVYRARHVMMDRPVAIKVLHSAVGPAKHKERFLREARIAASLSHPHLAAIYDCGATPDNLYMVMELLEGHDLRQELNTRGPITAARALPLFIQALEALEHGHKRGVVHRDLKPGNLFLRAPATASESLCVLDFGVAFWSATDERDERLTQTGAVVGTPKYYAPEYIFDQTITPALDVYQIALILVEVLSGLPPVSQPNAYTCAMRHCSGELEIPTPILESPLAPILAKALALDHRNRFASAGAFARALERVNPNTVPGCTPQTERQLLNKVFASKTQMTPLVSAEKGGAKTPDQRPSRPAIPRGELSEREDWLIPPWSEGDALLPSMEVDLRSFQSAHMELAHGGHTPPLAAAPHLQLETPQTPPTPIPSKLLLESAQQAQGSLDALLGLPPKSPPTLPSPILPSPILPSPTLPSPSRGPRSLLPRSPSPGRRRARRTRGPRPPTAPPRRPPPRPWRGPGTLAARQRRPSRASPPPSLCPHPPPPP